MEQEKNDNSSARGAELPDVKPKHAGGRPRKDQYTRGVQDILNGTASAAALLLRQLIERKRGHKRLTSDLQRACEYVIDHAIGKAKLKVEHSGGILTYNQLAKSATDLDKKPREIYADTHELSAKQPDKSAEN